MSFCKGCQFKLYGIQNGIKVKLILRFDEKKQIIKYQEPIDLIKFEDHYLVTRSNKDAGIGFTW